MILVLFLVVVMLLVVGLLVAMGRRETAQQEASLPAGTRVFAADLGTAVGVRELRGPVLRDDEWGLVGRPDLLLESAEGPIPNEYKRAPRGWRSGHSYRSHRLQVGVYLLLCEADQQIRRRPPEGRLRYVGGDGAVLPGGEVRVPNTEALRTEVVELLHQMRAGLRAQEIHRSHQFASRCRGCSVRSACGEAL